MDPQLTQKEFSERLTEIAKDAIREHCVETDTVEYKEYAALEAVYDNPDLLTDYPLSVEEYGSGEFSVDDSERLGSSSPRTVLDMARSKLLEGALDERIRELINGGWDAIKTETETTTQTRTVTKLDE